MQSDTKSFIVRIWVESVPDPEQPPTWRGVVEQVGNPKRLYFQDLDRAFQFVREQAGIGGNATTTPSSTLPWWKLFFKRLKHASHLPRYEQNDTQESHRD